jgi:sortase A
MNRKIGNTLILLGLLLLLGAGGLTAYNIWDGIRAERTSQHIIQEMDIGQDLVEALDREPDDDPEMPVIEVEGYYYIGILEIPSLQLTLPVMDRWDYTRLKISPCVYSGSYKTDDLVICAHNYARHFSPVKWIDMGADVYLITVDCRVYHYQVTNRETLKPDLVENMIENTNNTKDGTVTNEWDLTLFTCNTGGQTRCAVRCARIREEK